MFPVEYLDANKTEDILYINKYGSDRKASGLFFIVTELKANEWRRFAEIDHEFCRGYRQRFNVICHFVFWSWKKVFTVCFPFVTRAREADSGQDNIHSLGKPSYFQNLGPCNVFLFKIQILFERKRILWFRGNDKHNTSQLLII